VFPSNRAVHNRSICPLGNQTGSANRNGAVDDCHFGLEQFDVANRLPGEIPNLERVAHMKNVDFLNVSNGRRDVHSNRVVVPGNEIEEWLPYLSESYNNNIGFCFHDLWTPFGKQLLINNIVMELALSAESSGLFFVSPALCDLFGRD
jgi:hypothetical protein